LNEYGRFVETNIRKELEMMRVHVVALTHLTKLFVKDMVQRRRGYILNLGSTGSYAPFPMDAVYSATKAYVLNFSLAIRSELKGTGVSVTALTPGSTITLFAEKANMENTRLFSSHLMRPEQVAKTAIRAMYKRKSKVTPGLYNKLLVLTMKLTPYAILDKISPSFFKTKADNKTKTLQPNQK
jgi:short-subunit dehydrogenase